MPKAVPCRHKRQIRAGCGLQEYSRFHHSKFLPLLSVSLLRHSLRQTHVRLQGINTGELLPLDYARGNESGCAKKVRFIAARSRESAVITSTSHDIPPQSALLGNSVVMTSWKNNKLPYQWKHQGIASTDMDA